MKHTIGKIEETITEIVKEQVEKALEETRTGKA